MYIQTGCYSKAAGKEEVFTEVSSFFYDKFVIPFTNNPFDIVQLYEKEERRIVPFVRDCGTEERVASAGRFVVGR